MQSLPIATLIHNAKFCTFVPSRCAAMVGSMAVWYGAALYGWRSPFAVYLRLSAVALIWEKRYNKVIPFFFLINMCCYVLSADGSAWVLCFATPAAFGLPCFAVITPYPYKAAPVFVLLIYAACGCCPSGIVRN